MSVILRGGNPWNRLVALLAIGLLVLGGCAPYRAPVAPAPGPAAPSQMQPAVSVVSPGEGASLLAGDIPVTVQVSDFTVVDKQGLAAVAGEGHIHYFLDVSAPTTPGKPAVPESGEWAHVASTSHTFVNVGEGMHTISVELVNNDHTPLTRPVVATVTFTVAAEGGTLY
ncbi:MAG: hypothetical protein HY671_01780 [Chloroflexi bacterium]|nr:hypothetical protein [Chloroflexota bacterium]